MTGLQEECRVMKTAQVTLSVYILEYVSILGKLVASRYSDKLYPQYTKSQDGKRYNVSVVDLLLGGVIQFLTF